MKDLINSLQALKKAKINEIIESRINEFARLKGALIDDIFKELCFCIMTANCGAEKCIEIHENIGNDFLNLTQKHLIEKFKDLGYRFPNVRSQYIFEAREKKEKLMEKIKNLRNEDNLRDWIVKNIKGIGYKEASHFLRNIGYMDYAIIDFHIIDLLVKHNLIEKPKTLTKRKYLDIESILKSIGKKLNLTMGELDLYLWYMETGKVLK